MGRIAMAVIAIVLLSGCADSHGSMTLSTPTSTPDPYMIALGQAQVQATKQALDATSLAMSVSMTQTIIAPTVSAGQTATERAWVQTGWTATAESWTSTPSPSPTITATPTANYTATIAAAAASAKATAIYADGQSAELAAERERMMNGIWAVTPWLALVVVLGLCLVIVWKWSLVRPIQRDSRGDAPLLVLGGKIYDADRNPYPIATLDGDKPAIPALTAPEMQAATTTRDQLIDLASRSGGAAAGRAAANAAPQKRPALPQQQAVRVLPPGEAGAIMRDVLPAMLLDANAASNGVVIDEENHDEQ